MAREFLKEIKEEGLDNLTGQLDKWLNEISERGSGDDITLGLVCREDIAEGTKTESVKTDNKAESGHPTDTDHPANQK